MFIQLPSFFLMILGFTLTAAASCHAAALDLSTGPSTSLNLIEGFPDNYNVDGNLNEWSMPPSIILDRKNQVIGKEPIKDNNDYPATLWVSINTRGLLIAGKVQDSSVLFPKNDREILNSDHFEVWISFVKADMPPLGFKNQFGMKEITASDTQWNTWFSLQTKRRKILDRVFTRQFMISSLGIEEAYWKQAAAVSFSDQTDPEKPVERTYGEIFSHRKTLPEAKAVYKINPKGYTFESFIPADEFPASHEYPISHMKLLIDGIDCDQNNPRAARFMSSSLKREFGKPDTFNKMLLKNPLKYPSAYSLMGSTIHWGPSYFYFPGGKAQSIYAFVNRALGYQYEPEAASPEILTMNLNQKPVIVNQDLELYLIPYDIDTEIGRLIYKLAAMKDQKIISSYEFRGRYAYLYIGPEDPSFIKPAIIYKRNNLVHILFQADEARTTLGTGQGGADPAVVFRTESLPRRLRHKSRRASSAIRRHGEAVQKFSII
jgi:hypothetical protein